jgi:GT2 family glycosyltransferase
VNRTSPLYIVTPVHNRKATSVAFARLLRQQSFKSVVLVLVDDGSSDGTAEAVKAVLPSTVVLRGDGSLWWAGGLQKGLNWLAAQILSDDSYVAFMNDDVAFGDHFLEAAVEELVTISPGAFLSVPGVFRPSGRRSEEAVICDWPRFRYRDYGHHPERIDCCSTRVLFMRWGDLRRVGGLHPSLLPHYASDFEFTIRARRKGIRLVPAATVTAEFDDLQTGTHRTSGLSRIQRLRLMLTPRFSFNPLAMATYVWYSCPLPWKPVAWGRVLWSTLKFLR